MNTTFRRCLWICAILSLVPAAANAERTQCKEDDSPVVSFIQFSSPNLAAPQSPLTLKGKLSLPAQEDSRQRCLP